MKRHTHPTLFLLVLVAFATGCGLNSADYTTRLKAIASERDQSVLADIAKGRPVPLGWLTGAKEYYKEERVEAVEHISDQHLLSTILIDDRDHSRVYFGDDFDQVVLGKLTNASSLLAVIENGIELEIRERALDRLTTQMLSNVVSSTEDAAARTTAEIIRQAELSCAAVPQQYRTHHVIQVMDIIRVVTDPVVLQELGSYSLKVMWSPIRQDYSHLGLGQYGSYSLDGETVTYQLTRLPAGVIYSMQSDSQFPYSLQQNNKGEVQDTNFCPAYINVSKYLSQVLTNASQSTLVHLIASYNRRAIRMAVLNSCEPNTNWVGKTISTVLRDRAIERIIVANLAYSEAPERELTKRVVTLWRSTALLIPPPPKSRISATAASLIVVLKDGGMLKVEFLCKGDYGCLTSSEGVAYWKEK